jgi:hypothetical protein
MSGPERSAAKNPSYEFFFIFIRVKTKSEDGFFASLCMIKPPFGGFSQ